MDLFVIFTLLVIFWFVLSGIGLIIALLALIFQNELLYDLANFIFKYSGLDWLGKFLGTDKY